KLIIGREEGENNYLNGYKNQFTHVYGSSHQGPLILIDGDFEKADEDFTAQILGRFTQGKNAESVTMVFNYLDGTSKEVVVKPMPADE
ncbi:tRNA (5-methylaminomethyl-2-thiouridylate)-methyltransferase, partial [Francisella noatunensis subsp. orientalis]|nr:tRNA (5-methylaminomethyl-2-thiouridylate)-methyltransferase [Francisella orientalis]